MTSPTNHIGKISKFIASNALGTIVDTMVLWFFSHFIFEGYAGEYLVSPVISFECAVFTNFLCSWHFIWRDRSRHYLKSSFGRKYIVYNLSASATFIFKMFILLLLEHFFGWNVVTCNLIALCLSGSINFVMGEWVIFRKTKELETNS